MKEKVEPVLTDLLKMPNDALLNSKEAAVLLRVVYQTLVNWRASGDGPKYRRFGRRAMYLKGDLLAWATDKSRTFQHTAAESNPPRYGRRKRRAPEAVAA